MKIPFYSFKGQGDPGPMKSSMVNNFEPNMDVLPECILNSSADSNDKTTEPTQKDIDDAFGILAASINTCDNEVNQRNDEEKENVEEGKDDHNDTAAKNARTFFLEVDKKISNDGGKNCNYTKPHRKFNFDYKKFTAAPSIKNKISDDPFEENQTNSDGGKALCKNGTSHTLFRSNALFKFNDECMIPAKSGVEYMKPISSFLKNTPPDTPDKHFHNHNFPKFEPKSAVNCNEFKFGNVCEEIQFCTAENSKHLPSETPCSRPVEDRLRVPSYGHFDVPSKKHNNTPVEEISKSGKKLKGIKRILSKFEPGANGLAKRGKTPERNHAKEDDDPVPCSTLLVKSTNPPYNYNPIVTNNSKPSLHDASRKFKQSKNMSVLEYTKSLPREGRENRLNTTEGKRMSDSIVMEPESRRGENRLQDFFKMGFKTPKLNALQKKLFDETRAPRFSPAPKTVPDVPLGKVLTTYKTETLSISSATGTLALRSNAAANHQGMKDFKPMAHSTPFPTPRQSYGIINNNRNESRCSILPNDDKSIMSGQSNKVKESFISVGSHGPSNTQGHVAHISEEMYARKLTKLKNLIKKTDYIVYEAKEVLNECGKKVNFNGTPAELEANRAILIGEKRVRALRIEYERTKTLMGMSTALPRIHSNFLSVYVLDDIRLELNRLFCFKKTQPNTSYAFCIVFKCANNVIGTSVKTVYDLGTVRLRQVKFDGDIAFSKLPTDFIVAVEIYAMKLGQRERTRLSRFKRSVKELAVSVFKGGHSSKNTPLAPIDENGTCNNNETYFDSNQISFDEFTLCGELRLNRDTVGNQKFYLDNAKFPLEGTISLNTVCSALPPQIEDEYSGCLYVYNAEDFSRVPLKLWATVKRSIIKFWSKRTDVYQCKAPTSVIDMAKITSSLIEKLKNDEFGYKENSFHIDVLCEPSVTSYTYQQKRVYFTAECGVDCENWLNYLNKILRILRTGVDEMPQ
uniref:Anillin domain-containing protein n=1 Tax=Parastrongyloides trichosuri TaxID=131310 RepID=A0A0N4Z492_PARTI